MPDAHAYGLFFLENTYLGHLQSWHAKWTPHPFAVMHGYGSRLSKSIHKHFKPFFNKSNELHSNLMIFIQAGRKYLQFRHILTTIYRTTVKVVYDRPRWIFIPMPCPPYVDGPLVGLSGASEGYASAGGEEKPPRSTDQGLFLGRGRQSSWSTSVLAGRSPAMSPSDTVGGLRETQAATASHDLLFCWGT